MDKDIIIKGEDARLLQFLIINAQCHFNNKRVFTEIDRKTMNFAGDLLLKITKNRKGNQ